MSQNNGVIRVGRKGKKKFAFGEDGTPGSEPFEVDVVVTFQAFANLDDSYREGSEDRSIKDVVGYHQAVVGFVTDLARCPTTAIAPDITTAEALDFVARLHEQYQECATFFRTKSPEERVSPGSSGAELRFSVEES